MSARYEIDFAALTLRDALDLGILIEESARNRYAEFVDELEALYTRETANFFRAMMRNEQKHRDWLTRRRRQLFGDEPSRLDASMVPGVETPPREAVEAGMTLRRALETVLQAEIDAHRYFAQALPQISDPLVRKLFEELRDEEVEHQEMVRRELAQLPITDH